METNPQLELAYNFLQYTGTNIFLTGKAGTGKTTFLHNLKIVSPKRMIVLAPTGVAAINAGGMTLHSFFQLPFGPYIPGSTRVSQPQSYIQDHSDKDKGFITNRFSKDKVNIMRTMDMLVIDEISMVRADLLDAVSDVLCKYRGSSKPFGGVQLLLIGDLQQLAPVVKEDEWQLLRNHYESAFFFHSKALCATTYINVELKYVYRQADRAFIDLLNSVRNGEVGEQVLEAINKRYIPDFNPPDKEGYITLTTHNYQAHQINTSKLNKLKTHAYTYKATISGTFPEYSYPTDEQLVLKEGAQVMFVKNDSSSDKRYYNGKIGHIIDIEDNRITVKCDDNERIEVSLEEWSNTRYSVDEQTKEITETVDGTFIQYPLKTAWAITIHKSQGLTFEKAIIDAAAAFSHGQVYVALSRCKTLEGMVLISKLGSNAVIRDLKVKGFTDYMEQHQPDVVRLEQEKRDYFTVLLTELFDYHPIQKRLQYVTHLCTEHLEKLYPELVSRYIQANRNFRESLTLVGERFKCQLIRMVAQSNAYERDSALKERVIKGVEYFKGQMETILMNLLDKTHPDIDNKEVRKSFTDALEKLQNEADLKMAVLEESSEGFDMKSYMQVRAKAMIEKKKIKPKKVTTKIEVSSDIVNPALYKTLSTWRKAEAERLNLPAYTVLQQKALIGICNSLPAMEKELLKIPGVGKKILEKYGTELLRMVADAHPGQ